MIASSCSSCQHRILCRSANISAFLSSIPMHFNYFIRLEQNETKGFKVMEGDRECG